MSQLRQRFQTAFWLVEMVTSEARDGMAISLHSIGKLENVAQKMPRRRPARSTGAGRSRRNEAVHSDARRDSAPVDGGRSARCSSFTGARSPWVHQRSATLWWLNAATRVPPHAGLVRSEVHLHAATKRSQTGGQRLRAPCWCRLESALRSGEVGHLTGRYCAVRSTLPLWS